ncbi:hypothetical protein ACT3QQ_13865, partial [Psychrobacter sp. AOP7-A1-24]
MTTITVKSYDQAKNITEQAVVVNNGQPAIIQATEKVNYELLDESTGRAPYHVITKRVDNNLQLSFDEDIENPDLIIEGFYDTANSELIGLAEDGNYYYYIPNSGEYADYITAMPEGAIAGHALGGASSATPWWVGASEVDGFKVMPWLVGLGAIGAGLAVAKDLDSDDSQDGADGQSGLSAYEVWENLSGNEGKTEAEFIEAITGEQGVAGATGAHGESAFDVWEALPGNENKTEQDFIDSITGDDGVDGKSALELLVEANVLPANATVADLIEYLRGEDGADGTDGADGQDGADGTDGKSALELLVEANVLPADATV